MHEGSIVALRGWELYCALAWAFGIYLVSRFGRTRFLAGVYVGATLLGLWDWMLNDRWFFRITMDSRALTLATVDGRPWTVWAPLSYGFFFGITTLVCLRYRQRLDAMFGGAQYLVIGFTLGLADLVIEGITVGALHLYRFHFRQLLLWGVPLTNVVFITIGQATLLFLARRAALVIEAAGQPAIAGTNDGAPGSANGATDGRRTRDGRGGVALLTAPVVTEHAIDRPDLGWAPFFLGAMIPTAAMYAGAFPTVFLLHWLNPWS
jgi:hypothetical protein